MHPNPVSTDCSQVTAANELSAAVDSANAAVAWTLRRRGDSARCILCSIGDRVELHITMREEVLVSQQCRGAEQAAFVSNTWLAALLTRGWR